LKNEKTWQVRVIQYNVYNTCTS